MAERNIETIADVLRRVVRTLDIERELLTHAAGPVWARTVGERLALHTRATELRGGVLRVEARSASWLNEVSMLREQIRERLNTELKGILVREVRFRLGGGFSPLDASGTVKTVEASEEEIEKAAEELEPNGPDGARLIARAFALSQKKK